MRMTRTRCARLLAGAFLLCAGALPARAAERLRLAAERTDGKCELGGKVLVIARLLEAPSADVPAASCVFDLALPDLGEARIEEAASWLSALHSAAGAILELPATTDETHFAYAVKRLSSAFRGGSPSAPFAIAAEGLLSQSLEEEIDAYVDALVEREGREPLPLQTIAARWTLARWTNPRTSAPGALIHAIGREQK